MTPCAPQIRHLGRAPYRRTWEAMRAFTDDRGADTADEIWLVEHPPVFTLGLAGRPEHLLAPGAIPVVSTDRGGQVTYHGPGQVVLYPLLQLRRHGLGVRRLVTLLEQSVVDLLAAHGICGAARSDAPGVYVDAAKVAALGLRIRHGCSYHGLALNVAMDLEPFGRINPCGHPGMRVSDLQRLGVNLDWQQAAAALTRHLLARLEEAAHYQSLSPAPRGGCAP